MEAIQFDTKQKQSLRRRLLAWYARHRRDLPWRNDRDPYRVWVSEIMLQQTQVATVRAYFERFTTELPTVHDLAAADERQVLRLWEGLGYYRRARQMHAAAQVLVADDGGQFPRNVVELQKLPGIGRYTAGAIASIAFDLPAPILEANTMLSRLLAYRDDPTKSAGQKLLWQTAEAILPRKNVAEFNQALMELGSLVCTPKDPNCDACPLNELCVAHALGLEHEIPLAKKKPAFTAVREAAVVVRKNGRVLLRQCGGGERWTGLWDFPRFEVESEGPLFAADELMEKIRDLTGVAARIGSHLKTIKHGVTRYRITLDCYAATYDGGRVRAARWVPRRELDSYPLSTTGRKIVALLGR
jgi:A/G-specific adenine glycosylase